MGTMRMCTHIAPITVPIIYDILWSTFWDPIKCGVIFFVKNPIRIPDVLYFFVVFQIFIKTSAIFQQLIS